MLPNITNPIIFTLIAEIFLAILLILFWRKLRSEQQKHIVLSNRGLEQLEKLISKVSNIDRDLTKTVEDEIKESFDGLPSIPERLGNEGQKRLKKILDWQEREITREQELFVEIVQKNAKNSSKKFDDFIKELSDNLKKQFESLISQQEEIIVKTMQEAASKNSEDFVKAKAEIIKSLEKKSQALLEQVAGQTLRKSLDKKTQHQILMDTLDKAWETGIINEK